MRFTSLIAVLVLAACIDMSAARQQLHAARARRDAVIQQQARGGILSPAEAVDILTYDHAHDAAFDQSLRTPSYREPIDTAAVKPTYNIGSCPACEEGIRQADSLTEQQPATAYDLTNSYIHSPPAPMGMGEGARGWDGRIYIPAGPDPNPPPNVMGQPQ
jgi:hypothetical protein